MPKVKKSAQSTAPIPHSTTLKTKLRGVECSMLIASEMLPIAPNRQATPNRSRTIERRGIVLRNCEPAFQPNIWRGLSFIPPVSYCSIAVSATRFSRGRARLVLRGRAELSIVPAGPPPAISMYPASRHLRRTGRKPLSVRIAHSGDRSRNIPRFGGHAGGGARAVEKYRHRGFGIRQDAAGHTLKTAGSTC